MSEKGKCEPFSLQSAEEALAEILDLLSRAKKADAIGAANEIFVVLSRVPCQDRTKEYQG